MGIIAAMTDLVLSTHLAPRPHAASQLVTCWAAQSEYDGSRVLACAGALLLRASQTGTDPRQCSKSCSKSISVASFQKARPKIQRACYKKPGWRLQS